MIIQLAPMEGVVDPIIRDLFCSIGGYQICTSEFIRVTGNLMSKNVFYKYAPELKNSGLTSTGCPVLIQLLGSDTQSLTENAHKAIELGAPGIDINFGCPAKKVNNHGGGAALLEDPNKIHEILCSIKKIIPNQRSFSAKIRLGLNDKSKRNEIAMACSDAGIDWLSIHARTKLEAYKAPAHWHYIAEIKENIKCEIFANGEIWNKNDYQDCKQQSTCDNVVLGRGAFAFPELAMHIHSHTLSKENEPQNNSKLFKKFNFIKPVNTEKIEQFLREQNIMQSSYQSTENMAEAQWLKIRDLLIKHCLLCKDLKGDNYALRRTKQWSKFLGRNYPKSSEYFEQIKGLKNYQDLEKFHLRFQQGASI